MISNEEYQRRNNWDPIKGGPMPPCQTCPADLMCYVVTAPFPGHMIEEIRAATIPAQIRWGWSTKCGYPECLRLNYWLLGLDYERCKS